MHKILTLNKIADCGIQELPGKSFKVSSDEANPDGILLRSFAMEEKNLTPNLLAIARAGAGTNNIPVSLCADKGIVVFNTPGANANAVKELVIAALFLASRRIIAGFNWTQGLAGQDNVAKLVESGKSDFAGPEIAGKKMGVIGLGATGGPVANTCRSLGMHVTGFDPGLSVEAAWNLSRGVHKADNEDVICADCDYISIHVPANAETKHKFNEAFFKKCKKGVRILNFSRAELFDNDALKAAINDGTVECYVTDFPTGDLLGHEKIITIPHLGASTPESEDNCATMAAKQLRDYMLYGNIVNSVNFPDCEMPPSGKKRICVIHLNVVNVIGNITSILAGKNINIGNLNNRSKGNYAYTLIDVDEGDLAGIEGEIAALESIIRVRVL